MSNLATRIEKIEQQTNDIATLAAEIMAALRGLVFDHETPEAEYLADLQAARDRLAPIAKPYDRHAQYNLSIATGMIDAIENPKPCWLEELSAN